MVSYNASKFPDLTYLFCILVPVHQPENSYVCESLQVLQMTAKFSLLLAPIWDNLSNQKLGPKKIQSYSYNRIS